MPPVSIIILTCDRLTKLTECLCRLEPQLIDGDEVLVIDTGSADGTREAMSRRNAAWLRYVEFQSGGSWAEARNFAIDCAVNPLIAFLDDDCYASGDWIERGRRIMADHDAVGGYVAPHRIEPWPDWWIPEMGWLVGLSVPGHLGPEAGRAYYPCTANLWVRARVALAERFQELGGDFKGREEDKYQTGREDSEWWRRLRIKGYRCHYDPQLRVEHDIARDRLNVAYLRKRALRDGEAWVRREAQAQDLEPLAYDWWRRKVFRESPQGLTPQQRKGWSLLHEIIAARHGAALKGLGMKLAGEDPRGDSATLLRVRALLHAGARLLGDRARDIARRMALAYAPPPEWPDPSHPPRRVAVAAFGLLGDLVILQSCLRGFVKTHPSIEIALLTPRMGQAIFDGLLGIELTILPVESPNQETAQKFLRQWIRDRNPEVIVAPYLQGPWAPALVRLNRLEIPLAGFENEESLARRIDRERIPMRVKRERGEHESASLRRLFATVGLEFEPEPARISPNEEALVKARAWRLSLPPATHALPMLMINPYAAQADKEWSEGAWAEAAAELLEVLPHLLIFNDHRPNSELKNKVTEAAGRSDRVAWLPEGPLEVFIAVLSLCDGLITVDSSPQHLAHGLDTPSLTLYGPRDERRWADAFGSSLHQVLRRCTHDLTSAEMRGLPVNHAMGLIQPRDLVDHVKVWGKEFKTSLRD